MSAASPAHWNVRAAPPTESVPHPATAGSGTTPSRIPGRHSPPGCLPRRPPLGKIPPQPAACLPSPGRKTAATAADSPERARLATSQVGAWELDSTGVRSPAHAAQRRPVRLECGPARTGPDREPRSGGRATHDADVQVPAGGDSGLQGRVVTAERSARMNMLGSPILNKADTKSSARRRQLHDQSGLGPSGVPPSSRTRSCHAG
jgi:hypothetical protein